MSDPSTFGKALQKSQSDALRNFNVSKSQKDLNYKAFIVAQDQGVLVEAWMPETIGMDVNATYEAPFQQGLGAMAGLEGLSSMARFLGMSMTIQAVTAQVWQGGAFIEFTIPFIFQAETNAAQDVMLPIQRLLSLTMPKDPQGGGLLEAPGPRIDITKKVNGQDVDAVGVLKSSLGAVGTVVSEVGSTLASLVDPSKTVVSSAISGIGNSVKGLNEPAKALSTALVNRVVNNISLYLGKFLYLPSVVITDVSPTYDVVISNDGNPMRAMVNVGFRTFYLPTSNDIEIMFPGTAGLAQTTYNKSGGANTAAGDFGLSFP
jgi:hypothetical protein